MCQTCKPKKLKSGYRIIIGEWHVFRFNHPVEVAANRERMRSNASTDNGRSPRLGQDGNFSGTNSPAIRPDSPISSASNAEVPDWSFARREAVIARLNGTEINLDSLGEQDLNNLYHDILKVKGARRERASVGRSESRLSYVESAYDDDEDRGSSSVWNRPFSGETWTADDTSVDSGLALSAPALRQVDKQLREVRESMEEQLNAQRVEFEARLQEMAASSSAAKEVETEKAEMGVKLKTVQEEMQVSAKPV